MEEELHDKRASQGVSMAKRALPKDGKSRHFIVGVWLSWTAIAIVGYARHYFESTHPFEWAHRIVARPPILARLLLSLGCTEAVYFPD
jgi:hypothetical protein